MTASSSPLVNQSGGTLSLTFAWAGLACKCIQTKAFLKKSSFKWLFLALIKQSRRKKAKFKPALIHKKFDIVSYSAHGGGVGNAHQYVTDGAYASQYLMTQEEKLSPQRDHLYRFFFFDPVVNPQLWDPKLLHNPCVTQWTSETTRKGFNTQR